MKKVILLLILLGMSNALVMEKAVCPDVQTVENFDLSPFLDGLWYCFERYPNEFETNVTSSKGPRNEIYNFKTFGVPQFSSDYYEIILVSDVSSIEDMEFKMSFGEPVAYVNLKPKFLLFGANKYAVGYVCKLDEDNKVTYEYAWVIYRSRDPDPNTKAVVDEFLKSSDVIDRTKFYSTSGDN